MWIPVTGFFATFLLVFGVTSLLARGRGRGANEVLTGYGRRRLLFGALTAGLAALVPTGRRTRERLTTFLRHAGHYHSMALAEYLALRNVLTFGWILFVVAALAATTTPGDAQSILYGAAGAIIAVLLFSLPRLALELTAKARVRRIEEGLPDALDMITMCMSGGLPLQHAISKVSDQMQSTHPDMAFELRITGRHTEAGTLESAIKQFAQRLDVPEIHSLAATVWQTEQQGTGAAGAFQAFADNVRLHRRQRAEEAGNKTAVKMLFPLVFCLAPPVYLMLLSPAVIELTDFLKRESQPGGALSASPETMRDLFPKDMGGSLTVEQAASKAASIMPAAPAEESEETTLSAGPRRGRARPKLPELEKWP